MKENNNGNDTNVGDIEKNSIEEYIKILKSIIKINNDYLKGVENQTINQKEIKALEHILSDYKRVLKENEELKADNYELNNRITDLLENIPIQKVKDKIEELKSNPLKIKQNDRYYFETHAYNKIISVLKELIEESEK